MRCLLPLVTLLALPAFASADDVLITVGKDSIEFKAGATVVAKYATAESVAKPYLYPLIAPNGVAVTRAWPMEPAASDMNTKDHVHQKSVWFCHGDVIPEGVELKIKAPNKADKGVDFWSEGKNATGQHGKIKCVKVGKPTQHAKNHASIETHNEWISPDGGKIMDEVRVIHFIDGPVGRMFAFEIVLKATVCPITFGDTKEGSFGIRVRDELRAEKKKDTIGGDGIMTNAEGKGIEKEIWGLPSVWVHYAGRADGKEIGVAVFDHPSNPKASWHARAYGLVAANPFGRSHSGFPSQKGKEDLLKIAKGGEMKLKYAVYAHAGDIKAGKVAEAYEAFKK